MSLRDHNPARTVFAKTYSWAIKFDTNGTSAPDGVAPDWGSDVTVARSDTGDYTITFAGDAKPLSMIYGDACILGDEARLDAKVVSYTASTGVLAVTVYQEQDDGADTDPDNGISIAADTTDKTVQVHCIFTRSDAPSNS